MITKKEPEVTFKNLEKRELSPFMAEQLLYDYATNQMDSSRQMAVAATLKSEPELAKALDDIIYGMTYCHHLKKTRIAPEFLEKFRSPMTMKSRFKMYRNIRYWNQNSSWILESVGISLFILILSLVIPWPKYLKLFLEKQAPFLFLSEVPRDSNNIDKAVVQPSDTNVSITNYESQAELKTVNPQFTVNKLQVLLPRLRASIEHSSMRKASNGEIQPYLKISIPINQTEALFSELKSQGQLTWITPPSENTMGSKIFGMELWVIRVDPPKSQAPAKDENGE